MLASLNILPIGENALSNKILPKIITAIQKVTMVVTDMYNPAIFYYLKVIGTQPFEKQTVRKN